MNRKQNNFAKKLKQLLLEKEMSQAELSRQTSIKRSMVSEYMSSKYKPKTENLIKISKALDVNISYFFE